MPDDTIKKVWNILMIFLLFYVATWVPVNICFNQETSEEMTTVDWIDMFVDILFGIDILINFLSSYEDPVT
jgi:hypothetical protein